MSRLRVAMIGSRGFPNQGGGVERVLEAVTPRIVASGVDVVVYCADYVEYPGDDYHGVRLRRVRSLRTKYADTFTRSLIATVRELLRGDADVVHFHGIGSAPLSLLPRLLRRPTVVTVHGLDWQRSKWNPIGRAFLRFGEWAAVRFPHETVVVSRQLQNYLEDRHGRDVTYIPNGAEPRTRVEPGPHLAGWSLEPDRYLLFLGRLVPEKGAHVLITAFQALRDAADLKLVLAGPAWFEPAYNAQLRELAGDDARILFVDEVDEPPLRELYSHCRAYVLPSDIEGMSLSLLDAMAFGCCVVTSSIPENATLVGDAGLVFETNDAASLTAQLQRVVDDDELVDELRGAARARSVDEFNWDLIGDQWLALYERMVQR